MSADCFLITPQNYDIHTFLRRIPLSIKVYDLEDGRYNFEINSRNVWLDTWEYKETNYSSLNDAFTEEQMISINQISNPKFFVITAGNWGILNIVVECIADDPNILICNDTNDPILPGDEFVKRIKQGK